MVVTSGFFKISSSYSMYNTSIRGNGEVPFSCFFLHSSDSVKMRVQQLARFDHCFSKGTEMGGNGLVAWLVSFQFNKQMAQKLLSVMGADFMSISSSNFYA